LPVYVALAARLGWTEIVLSDLVPSHVERTRARAGELFGTETKAEGVTLQYAAGDVAHVALEGSFALVQALWWVTAEILDPSSAQAIHRLRHHVYTKLHGLLSPGGAFLEDVPDADSPGFYHLAVAKSAHILGERGILYDKHTDLLLSNWTYEQSDGFPYQLRIAPSHASEHQEKERVGFRRVLSVPALRASSASASLETAVEQIRGQPTIWEAIAALRQMQQACVRHPNPGEIDVRRRKLTWWEKRG
jgi:SAM-dependent methyltransferase